MKQENISTRMYINLLTEIKNFFIDQTIPVAWNESLEIQHILTACEKSLDSGKEEKLSTLMQGD